MWATILSLFPTIAGWINDISSWIGAKIQAQNNANSAETSAEAAGQNGGAQSVADMNSDNAQNAALTNEANSLDNPTPIVVTTPTGGKSS